MSTLESIKCPLYFVEYILLYSKIIQVWISNYFASNCFPMLLFLYQQTPFQINSQTLFTFCWIILFRSWKSNVLTFSRNRIIWKSKKPWFVHGKHFNIVYIPKKKNGRWMEWNPYSRNPTFLLVQNIFKCNFNIKALNQLHLYIWFCY